MGKPWYRNIPAIYIAVILLGVAAFFCCVGAEFKKLKVKDMKVDGNLCYLPRSSAFGLSIAALVCLSIAQIAGTSVAATRMCTGDRKLRRGKILSISCLVLSWITFGLAGILLGTGASMNEEQAYGRGWMKGECYLVKDGVYVGTAVVVTTTAIFITGFIYTTRMEEIRPDTSTDEERKQRIGQ